MKILTKKKSRKMVAILNELKALLKVKRLDELEPKTHCCECTPGDHYERHCVHIQYPGCNCDPKKYILKVNY